MMLGILITLGILMYIFLARVFRNLAFGKKDVGISRWYVYFENYLFGGEICPETVNLLSTFFPITIVIKLIHFLIMGLQKIFITPMGLADKITNPDTYKFKIKLERRD